MYIPIVRYVANIHHIKYGICKYPDILFFCKYSVINVYTSITNISVHIIAMNFRFSVKNIIVHVTFIIS